MAETETMTPGRAAAMWWAEQIGAPIHMATTGRADDPDREYGDFVFMAMQTISARHPVTTDQGAAFVAALAPVIDDTMGDWLSLDVDYGPCLMLANAAKSTGIDLSRFPIKTHMSMTPMYVIAALGYGSPNRLIWRHPEWDRPACNSMRYEERPGQHMLWFEEVCGLPRFHEDREHGDWKPDTAFCTSCGRTQAAHWNDDDRSHTFKRPGAAE